MLVVLASALLVPVAFAASQVDVFHFDNEEQRARYKALIDELRCPKCLNTNISGSDAPIAQDLRRLVHKFVVVEGKSDEEILSFLRDRYGDFVLYDPPFDQRTWLIWLLPAIVGFLVLAWLLRLQRAAKSEDVEALTAEELAALDDFERGK